MVGFDEGCVVGGDEGVEFGEVGGVGAVPGALDFAEDGVGGGGDDAGLGEAGEGDVGYCGGWVAGGVDDGVDFVAGCFGVEGGEHDADAGPDAGHDEGFFSGFADGLDEEFVVECVDFSFAGYVDGVGGGGVDFGHEGAVGSFGLGGGCDDGDFD